MTEKVRAEVTPSINDAIKNIQTLLSQKVDQPLTSAGLKALRAIGNTMCPGEENSLSDTVPSVLNLLKSREVVEPAMSTLSSISYAKPLSHAWYLLN